MMQSLTENLSKGVGLLFITLSLVVGINIEPGRTQSITAAPDGTGTIITKNGQQYNISGGSFSRDRKNLFQSFERFGLNRGEIANFVANPTIANILGRVVGGSPSEINGLIRVINGNPNVNVFLMNPAGVIIGPNANINVPGAFRTTTANRIDFPGGSFNAVGANNYSALVGSPTLVNSGTVKPEPDPGVQPQFSKGGGGGPIATNPGFPNPSNPPTETRSTSSPPIATNPGFTNPSNPPSGQPGRAGGTTPPPPTSTPPIAANPGTANPPANSAPTNANPVNGSTLGSTPNLDFTADSSASLANTSEQPLQLETQFEATPQPAAGQVIAMRGGSLAIEESLADVLGRRFVNATELQTDVDGTVRLVGSNLSDQNEDPEEPLQQ
jgi:filamentous hemagglutinin family protein